MKRQLLKLMTVTFVLGLVFLSPARPLGVQRGVALASFAPMQQRLLSGFARTELSQEPGVANLQLGTTSPDPLGPCAPSIGSNIRVNRDCLNVTDQDLQGRGQAKNSAAIAIDPLHPTHVVSTYNNYRRGDQDCGSSYSTSSARTWNDTEIPTSFTHGAAFGAGAREYWEAGGDTSVAWDTKGNAYLACQVFQRGTPTSNNPDLSNGVYVFRSTQSNGASWNFPGHPAIELSSTTGVPFADKPYMTVDNHVGSPFQDRIYVTWTEFAADGDAYIFEAHSNDYGQSFSSPVVVSNTSSLCANTYGVPTPSGACNENQFSQPFTGADGNLYVVYNNFNNSDPVSGDTNAYQVLLEKSVDGGASFGPPVLVAPYNDLPDCATYQGGQDIGRSCVPEKGGQTDSVFRASNYPSGAVNPRNSQNVVVTFGSYINKYSNPSNGCSSGGFSAYGNPLYTGVKTVGACNNKIVLSVSTDGGTTFTGGGASDPSTLPVVPQATAQRSSDQWWQWTMFSTTGKVAVSYYDRQYGSDESNGSMDISLSGLSASSASPTSATLRVTSSSMPLPTEFPDAQGNSLYFGDYSGLSAGPLAYPIWMDTRAKDLFLCPGTAAPGVPPAVCNATEPNGLQADNQDIFTRVMPVP